MNPNFNCGEFDHFKSQAGLPTFGLSPGLWKERTNAIGFIVLQGKCGELMLTRTLHLNFVQQLTQFSSCF
jgi:hypothetical protein